MGIFFGNGVRSWPDENSPPATWLCTAPVYRSTDYPVLLDFLDNLDVIYPSRVRTALGILIPKHWEDIKAQDPATAFGQVGFSDTYSSESSAEELFLERTLARLITSVPNCGVLLRDVHQYDSSSVRFCRTLIHEARVRGVHVAVDSAEEDLQNGPLWDLLNGGIHVPLVGFSPRGDELAIMTSGSLVNHCIPLSLVTSLGVEESLLPSVQGVRGELFVDFRGHQATVNTPQLSGDLQRLYNAWPPDRWGYLRRAFIGLRSGHIPTVAGQQRSVLRAFQVLNREFFYRYLVQVSALDDLWHGTTSGNLHCLIGAARLATRISLSNGFQQAECLYRAALTHILSAAQQTQVTYELANLLAVQRTTSSLERARWVYREAFQMLSLLNHAEESLKLRIQLLNGLALVEYHQHNDRQAFRLEHRARLVAENARSDYPHIAEWALELINMNTATLLNKRFKQFSVAEALLHENLTANVSGDGARTRLLLGCHYFDLKNYDAVIEILSGLFDGLGASDLPYQDELLGRVMFIGSLVALERHQEAQSKLMELRAFIVCFGASVYPHFIAQLLFIRPSDLDASIDVQKSVISTISKPPHGVSICLLRTKPRAIGEGVPHKARELGAIDQAGTMSCSFEPCVCRRS